MLQPISNRTRRIIRLSLLLCVLTVLGTLVYLCMPRARGDEILGDPKTQEEATGLDLDTDTNNNGAINDPPEEDEYEAYPSGRVVCLDRKGDGEDLEDYALIAISPPDTDEGTLHLEVVEGEDKIQGVEESLPASWSPPTSAPEFLNINGIKVGQAKLKLWYEGPTQCDPDHDIIAIYVTETISWAPAGNWVTSYAPCCDWWLPSGGITKLHDQVKDHGWDVTTCFFKDEQGWDDDCGTCSLINLRAMKHGGIAAVLTHGDIGEITAVYLDTQQAAEDWKADEPYMEVYYSTYSTMWGVAVDACWLSNNWKPELDARKSIFVGMSCYSLFAGESGVVGMAGGRVGLGYEGEANAGACFPYDMERFFKRMNGSTEGAQKRTAGKAIENGFGYKGLKMLASPTGEWTTLNPSPNAVFPAEPVGGRRGAGCSIFDTYMDDSVSADLAVQKVSVNAPVSTRWWFSNGSEEYLVSFDFYPHAAGSVTMKAEADCCKNKKETGQGSTRKLSGDRKTYEEDKEWSF